MSAQPNLFTAADAASDPVPAPKRDRVCVESEQCARLLGLPGWRWYSARVVEPSGLLYRGAVCRVRFTKGPRKGSYNWDRSEPGTDREVMLTRESREAFKRTWQAETGMCGECGGSAVQAVSASVSGTTYRWCPACHGTGDAPAGGSS